MSAEEKPRIEDPAEVNQRKRLEAISSARQQARDIRLRAEVGDLNVDPEQAFFTAVQNYALELEWLMWKHGDESYRSDSLGEIVVSPPSELKDMKHGRISWKEDGIVRKHGRIFGTVDREPKSKTVVGLLPSNDAGVSYLELGPTWTETWSVKIELAGGQTKTRLFEETVRIPYEISLSAFQRCNKFINDVELDARLEDQLESDYV